MQKFKFPMEYLKVTQGENSAYSHTGSLAMDFGGKDRGADRLFCPCDMVVKRTRKNANGEVYLESVDKVQFADGSVDYARLLCLHDGTFNVKEGQVLKQGEYFYDEGGMGAGNKNKFATHVHIEAGKGKWKSATQSKNSKGTYVMENQAHLYDLFVVGDDVVILDDGGYSWVRESKTAPPQDSTTELEALKAELTETKVELAKLKEENGVLKEIIVSLQEKVEAVTKENELLRQEAEKPVKEGLLVRILKILFGGA